jgi:quercetin dioxygenase-like cupin family protein
MNKRNAIATLALMLLSAVAWGQAAYPTQELLATGTTVVGEPIRYPTAGPAHITASIVTIAPGAPTAYHRHPVPMVAYILEGELTVDYGDHGKRIYRKGDALVEAMDVRHRGMNLGAEIVRLLAVYIGAEGTPNVALEK